MAGDTTATLTFLFTDLESSTRMWEEHSEAMKAALARHDEIVRHAIDAQHGRVFSTSGDGLAAAFVATSNAVAAALDAQCTLGEQSWGETGPLRARMAVHTGEAHERDGDWFGPALNRAARLMAIGHGGQVLLTHVAEELARDALPPGASLIDLGEHRLRDLAQAEQVFQLVHPDLQREFAALRSLQSFAQNLPVQRSVLLGRDKELARIGDELDRHRLVTLTGVGGVGKTRLALQAAADLVDRYADGAWLLALATVTDPALAANAAIAELRITERPGVTATQTLVDALRGRRMLLVLDNCEHLLDAVARLADTLLASCPGVSMIATSREAFGVDGEQILPTPSLALPSRDAPLRADDAGAAAAIELFCERARAVRPDFELGDHNVAAVVELCSRLDGIPLAIELAAARVNALAPADILARLDRRFLLLTGKSRTALERHQTLRAAVDWSYDLLSQPERRLFERLSVFVGGFTLDSAEAVCTDNAVAVDDALDLLAGLVAKSMVIADDAGSSRRYTMLETLRQYGRDRLADRGEAETFRTRHASHFVEVAVEIGTDIRSARQLAGVARTDAEMDNLRAALDWFVETGDASSAVHLLQPLAWGTMLGLNEWMQRHEAVLAIADRLESAERAELLALTAYAAAQAGAHGRARILGEECLRCAADATIAAPWIVLSTLGLVAFWANEHARGIALIEESVVRTRDMAGSSPSAGAEYASCLQILGFQLGQVGETERAIAIGEETLLLARANGAHLAVAGAAFTLGLSYRPIDPERSLELLDEAFSVGDIWLDRPNGPWLYLARAQVQDSLRQHEAALTSCRRALEQARNFGARWPVPPTLEAAARISSRLGRWDEAARMLGAAERLREETSVEGGPADAAARDRTLARLREAMSTDDLAAAWQAGHALSFDDATRLLRADTGADLS